MKNWKKILLGVITIPIFIFVIASAILIINKDKIVYDLILDYNESVEGRLELKSVSLSPFQNFPYISLDLVDFKIFENETTEDAFIELNDVYVGFDVLKLIRGDYEIKNIQLNSGAVRIIQDIDDNYNVSKAFKSKHESESLDTLVYSLEKIKLNKVHISKLNLTDSLMLSTQVDFMEGNLKSFDNELSVDLKSSFILDMIKAKDTSFLKDKLVELDLSFSYDFTDTNLNFGDSKLKVENGEFSMSGSIDLANDVEMDLEFGGVKNNFDLLIGLSPQEVGEALKLYENSGDVFFEASLKGKSINGFSPYVEAKFGCENGFFDNIEANTKLSNLNFLGIFSNGEERHLRTSELKIQNLSASPESGVFLADLSITNFESPEINLKLESDFDLDFLSGFFNLNTMKNLRGQVKLKMNFNDIIDLENPELALSEFNQSYYSELEINNLNFTTDSYHLPISNLNLKAKMDKKLTTIENFKFKLGESDLGIKGTLTNLPDIVHKTNETVKVNLELDSKLIDLKAITRSQDGQEFAMDEQIHNLKTKLKFEGAANTFELSENLPVGTFYVEDFFGKLTHYPHELHDFYARVYIDKHNLEVVDFKGMVDDSDFKISGNLSNYDLYFQDTLNGDVVFDFDIASNLFRLNDIFTYREQNHVPEDYREEVLRNIKTTGKIELHYNNALSSSDFFLHSFEGNMNIHPLKFENFEGKFHLENDQLTFNNFKGKLGKSQFNIGGQYYFGEDEVLLKKGNRIDFKALYLDLDELTNYEEVTDEPVNHDDVFNIFEVPFPNMEINASIGTLNYHNYNLKNLTSKMRIQKNHYVFFDDMRFEAASGKVDLSGYFNGSNPDSIYMHPDLKLQNVDLDQLLFKFDNFGQDQIISDNLHGRLTGRINGKILLHADLTPYIEKSELDIDVSVTDGMLENFEPMLILSEYFDDKNLNKVFFGKMENRLKLKDGNLIIPNMLLNSSLGFMQLSGKQSLDLEMDYYLRIPLKMVTQVAMKKLFGRSKKEIDPEQEDEIIYKDTSRNTNYVGIRILGTPDNYSFSLRNNKEEGDRFFEATEDFLFDDISISEFSW